MADDDAYVSTAAWVRLLGRPDAVDEVADTFERPRQRWTVAPSLPMDPPSQDTAPAPAQWPRRSGGWRSAGLLHGRSVEERLHG